MVIISISKQCTPKYNYNTVIELAIKFYEAQQSGELSANNIFKDSWRKDSTMKDGEQADSDYIHSGTAFLTGGYFDAGDYLKLNFKGAHMATVLAWSAVEFKDGYTQAGEYDRILKTIKWQTDYLLKCHIHNDYSNGKFNHYF